MEQWPCKEKSLTGKNWEREEVMEKMNDWERWNKYVGMRRTVKRQCVTMERTSQRDSAEPRHHEKDIAETVRHHGKDIVERQRGTTERTSQRDSAAPWKGHRRGTMSNGKKNEEPTQRKKSGIFSWKAKRRKQSWSEIEPWENCKVRWNEVWKYVSGEK